MSEASSEHLVQLADGTTICFRDTGRRDAPVVLLVAGLGEDLDAWGDPFVSALVTHGLRVVTMDNRDVGRSTFSSTAPPATWRQVLARPRPESYSLTDMARDCVGVLDHLGVAQAHVVGRSMGGMIAQVLAAAQPHRVLSLTSLYSTTGARGVGQPARSTIGLLVLTPEARTRTAFVRAHLRMTQHIAGTAYPIDDAHEAAIAARAWDRSAGHPIDGVARQIEAIQRSGDRTAQLRRVTAPTLVIHGDRDLMVAPSGGVATVAAIEGAQHVVIPGMGHHLHDDLVDPLARYVAGHAARAGRGDALLA